MIHAPVLPRGVRPADRAQPALLVEECMEVVHRHSVGVGHPIGDIAGPAVCAQSVRRPRVLRERRRLKPSPAVPAPLASLLVTLRRLPLWCGDSKWDVHVLPLPLPHVVRGAQPRSAGRTITPVHRAIVHVSFGAQRSRQILPPLYPLIVGITVALKNPRALTCGCFACHEVNNTGGSTCHRPSMSRVAP